MVGSAYYDIIERVGKAGYQDGTRTRSATVTALPTIPNAPDANRVFCRHHNSNIDF